ncbi:MAG: AraC family transcriptional regulator [Pseudobutyrivibrio sp.]|nr:AraC family transcriptional regulator [Pseudobutyrivibrio sp.]
MSTHNFKNSRVRGKRIIYTASPFAKNNLIYLQEIGFSEYLEPYVSKRGTLSSFLFFYVEDGEGVLDYNGIDYHLKKGDCAFINCNNPYLISSSNHLWNLAWVHFNGASMPMIHSKYLERSGSPCFEALNSQKIKEIHQNIFHIADCENYVKDMSIMSALTRLLEEIMRQCWKSDKDSGKLVSAQRWQPIKDYIDINYKTNISLDDLSIKFAINKFYLTRKFKNLYGNTIGDYITNLRITNAKELLRFSDLSITEVAQTIGYNDSAYFARVFTKAEGISPSEFRKQWQIKSI